MRLVDMELLLCSILITLQNLSQRQSISLIFTICYTMSPAAIEEIKLVTEHLPGDISETPSPDGPLYAVPASRSSSVSTTTWLKLNSNAPTQIKVEEVPSTSHDEPFTGAKKLRHLLKNTDELVVCPGVYDGLSARTAIELGFKSLYMVGLSVLILLHSHTYDTIHGSWIYLC